MAQKNSKRVLIGEIEITKKLILYLIDVIESLNCPVSDLITKAKLFDNESECDQYVNDSEYGRSFCLLKKHDSTSQLFFLPITRCMYESKEGRKGHCTDPECQRFHLGQMCYYYVTSKCQFGSKCTKKHRFNRWRGVFAYRKLTDQVISDDSICKLIRLSEKQSIRICNYLKESDNEVEEIEMTCSGEWPICDSLHICKHSLTGASCKKSSQSCVYRHGLFDEINKSHNECVLEARGLNELIESDLWRYCFDAYHCKKIKCGLSGGHSSKINNHKAGLKNKK